MMKNRKRIVSTLATLCLSVSLAVPAFAAESEKTITMPDTGIVSVLEEGKEYDLMNGAKNGLVNGAVNGMTNGLVEGIKNGLVNGAMSDMKNGLVDGLKNGELKGN